MRLLLIACTCLMTSLSAAQNTYLLPFKEYTSCLIGFKDQQGEISWPAQFEEVELLYENPVERKNAHWLLKLNGKYGLISQSTGQMTVPCTYSSLKNSSNASDNSLLAIKDRKKGIINFQHEVLVPFVYDEISCDAYQFYRADLDHKTAVFNWQFRQIVPPIYDEVILRQVENARSRGLSYIIPYFMTRLNGKYGLLDSAGHVLLQHKYLEIEISPVDPNCGNTAIYFTVCSKIKRKVTATGSVLEEKLKGVVDATGKVIVPLAFEYIRFMHASEDSCDATGAIYVVASTKHESRIYNLRTGARCKMRCGAIPFDNLLVFGNKKGWGIMDTNFRVQVSGKRGDPTLFRPYWTGEQPGRSLLIRNKVILVQEMYLAAKHKREPAVKDYVFTYGLYDFRSGKTLPAIFDEVILKTDDTTFYYWCIRFEPGSLRQRGEIAICDTNLQLIRRLAFADEFLLDKDLREDASGRLRRHQNNVKEIMCGRRLIVFGDSLGRYGAVNVKGEMVIPFAYSAGTVRMIQIGEFKWEMFYEFSNAQGSSLFNADGKGIADYKSLEYEKGYYIVQGTSGWRLLDSSFQVLNQGFENMPIFSFKGNDYELEKYDFAGVLNNYLYVFDGKEFTKLDSTKIRFPNYEPLWNLFPHEYLINKTGRIVNKEDKSYTWTPELSGTLLDLHLTVTYKGLVKLEMDSVQFASMKDDRYIEVQLMNQQKGLIDIKTGAWVLAPRYSDLMPALIEKRSDDEKREIIENRFWVRSAPESQNATAYWSLIDGRGKKVSEIAFDFPVHFQREGHTVFRSGNLFGLLNAQLRMVLPADNQHIVRLEKLYAFKQNDRWGLLTVQGKRLSPQFTDISRQAWKGQLTVFNGDKAGVLRMNLEWIVKPTAIAGIIETLDLVKIFGLQEGVAPETEVIYTQGLPDAYRKINNSNLLRKLAAYSLETVTYEILRDAYLYTHAVTQETLADMNLYMHYNGGPYMSAEPVNPIRNSKIGITPTYTTSTFYSAGVSRRFYTGTTLSDFGHERYWSHDYQGETFRISGDQFIPVTLADLLMAESTAQLDALIFAQILKDQHSYLHCVDMQDVIQRYKKCFTLTKEGIRMFDAEKQRVIVIPYDALITLLRNPAAFGL
jgi:hypothetical protein